MSRLTDSPAWKALDTHRLGAENLHMRDLFERDPNRFEKFSIQLEDILFDYSKNRITQKTLSLLLDLARQEKLEKKIQAMFAGEKINATEG
ncbi:MAG: glucose-6-phosphate isomerase, partial [Thermodesulfobacteriota bacterium]|nr:glucose-6-phosphate isomerase [Thermodesulfobacteriota bacterium]